MTAPARLSVHTVAPGAPFLATLARAILSGELVHGGVAPDPLALAAMEVLLPSRRAARALAATFPAHVERGALLLPRISTLGDIDDEPALRFAADAGGEGPVVSDLERRIVLADIARQWAEARAAAGAGGGDGGVDPVPRSAAEAAAFARELARLFDAMEVEEIDGARLAGVLPEDRSHLARNWDVSLDFLTHALARWTEHLAGRGLASRIARRARDADRLAARLREHGSPHPVVAAGSTGSVPATARLMRAIAGLDNGAVVLPGLDLDLDDESWAALEPDHPQFGLKALLEEFGIGRGDVRVLGAAGEGTSARARLASEAMRPAATTDKWVSRLGEIDADAASAALAGVELVAAANEFEEARVIALHMRAALEAPGEGTVALVTPDRNLARRVRAELTRWRIEVDDSAGLPLDATAPGVFLVLLAETVIAGFPPLGCLGLLKHPMTRLGLTAAAVRGAARTLELMALRGARPAPGIGGLRGAFAEARGQRQRHPVLRRQGAREAEAAARLIDALDAATRPLREAAAGAGAVDAGRLTRALVETAEAVAAVPAGEAPPLWRGPAGEALAGFLADLADTAAHARPIEPASLPGWLTQLMAGETVRARGRGHPRLAIWGPLEARLQTAGTLILGGLNEGVWPAEAETDPWLGRHMRAAIGLAPPERRLGLQAHDFTEGLMAPRVVLTRAEKAGGTPTVPSRWLWRLEALADGLGLGAALGPAAPWIAWARGLDPAPEPEPAPPPAPRPPVDARPTALSVTRIETLIRDPYAIYARHVLGLEPLDPADQPPDARESGTMIHEALARLLADCPAAPLPPDALDRLMDHGRDVFAALDHRPGLRAYWWGRFERIARWIVEGDAGLRPGGTRSAVEVGGRLAVAVPGLAREFTLTARADRIDIRPDGGVAILDYKTGGVPAKKQIETMLAPQLPLEAAILAGGGFTGLAARTPEALTYLKLSGRDPAGERVDIEGVPADLAAEALARLQGLLARYADAETAYRSRVMPVRETIVGEYDHLARVGEWSERTGRRHGG